MNKELIKSKNGKMFVGYTSGDVYGYLILTGKSYMNGTLRYVECICECGKIWFTPFTKVKSGGTKSCGCKRGKILAEANTTHGMASKGTKHPIYRAWHQMQERCKGNTKETKRNYFDRGITVSEEWVNNFDLFHKWSLENGWSKGLTLDRIDNEFGNYEPSNCRWVNNYIQSRNKTTNFNITAFGETKCVTDWALDPKCSISVDAIADRIRRRKWNAEDAITLPKFSKMATKYTI